MPSGGRSIVWSLLTAIVILLVGVMGLLYVSYYRDRQYESEIQNLRHKVAEKDAQIEELQKQFRQQTEAADSMQTTPPTAHSW